MAARQKETIAVERGRYATAASRILEILRGEEMILREEVVHRTQLSPATVARTTAALIDAGMARERHDHSVLGRMGRPAIPVALVEDQHVCIGIHIGRWVTTVSLGDLRGHVLARTLLDHQGGRLVGVPAISEAVGQLLNRFLDRLPLAAGLVAPWRSLGLPEAATAAGLRRALGLPVATGDHVAAVAAAEFVLRRPPPGVTCYLYARNVSGFVLVVDKGVQTEVSRVADLTHFPTSSQVRCWCGRTGCFEAAVGEHALVERATALGIIAAPQSTLLHAAARTGSAGALELLRDRANLLGRTAALVRDMAAPDRMVLLGQAVTGFPEARAVVRSAFDSTTALGPFDLAVTGFGDEIQAVAACFIALGPVYDDPLGALPA